MRNNRGNTFCVECLRVQLSQMMARCSGQMGPKAKVALSTEGTPAADAKQAFFTRQAVGYVLDWHTAPGRQYVITLSGEGEIEVGDGTKKLFAPGDVLLAEDTTGQGHVTRVVGYQPRTMMWVPLE